MKKIWGNPWIGTLFRLVLAGVLLYAGAIKLFEPDGARDAIVAYRIFGGSIPSILGWVMPIAEVIMGLLLLIGLFVRWAGFLTACLMTAFVLGIVSVWVRGYNIDCGCFGGGGDITADGRNLRYTYAILRDLLFVGMGVWLVAWPRTKFGLDAGPSELPKSESVTYGGTQKPTNEGHDHG
jgi:uncharacterized membrane protein YphA (DoxX/SURF4 family)